MSGFSRGGGLERFVEAQRGDFETARAELLAGRKRSHWMWYIFPQLQGLGSSPTSEFYGIAGMEEAVAYLGHPVLGPRLVELSGIVEAIEGRSAAEIFGYPDDLKLKSCMTLFEAAGGPAVFGDVLGKLFAGERDSRTLGLLGRSSRG